MEKILTEVKSLNTKVKNAYLEVSILFVNKRFIIMEDIGKLDISLNQKIYETIFIFKCINIKTFFQTIECLYVYNFIDQAYKLY